MLSMLLSIHAFVNSENLIKNVFTKTLESVKKKVFSLYLVFKVLYMRIMSGKLCFSHCLDSICCYFMLFKFRVPTLEKKQLALWGILHVYSGRGHSVTKFLCLQSYLFVSLIMCQVFSVAQYFAWEIFVKTLIVLRFLLNSCVCILNVYICIKKMERGF